MIIDTTGNAIDSFDDLDAAREMLRNLVTEDPTAAGELALLWFDDAGYAFGEPEVAADIVPDRAYSVSLTGMFWDWVQIGATKTFIAPWQDDSARDVPALNSAASLA